MLLSDAKHYKYAKTKGYPKRYEILGFSTTDGHSITSVCLGGSKIWIPIDDIEFVNDLADNNPNNLFARIKG